MYQGLYKSTRAYCHILICITMCSHILPCITMHCHEEPCIASISIYHVLPCIAMYSHVFSCIAMYCHVLPCIAMYSHVLPCIAMYWVGPQNPLVYRAFGTHHWRDHANITHIPSYHPPRKNSRRCPCFFSSCFTRREKSASDLELGNNFRDVTIFQLIINQLLYSCGANTRWVCVGIPAAMTTSKFF